MSIKKIILALVVLTIILSGCKNDSLNADPEPANEVTDELYENLRDSILLEFEKNQYDSIFGDSIFMQVYNKFYENEKERIAATNDSIENDYRENLDSIKVDFTNEYNNGIDSVYSELDSIQQETWNEMKDSIYEEIYDEVYNDLYSNAASSNLHVIYYHNIQSLSPYIYPYLDDIYGDSPIAGQLAYISIVNKSLYTYYMLKLEVEISGITETSIVQSHVNSGDTLRLIGHPALIQSAFASLSSEVSKQVKIKVSVIHNDKETPFFETTRDITIYPANSTGVHWNKDDGSSVNIDLNYGHWIQPTGDSITSLISDIILEHPDSNLVGYQDPTNSGNYTTITSNQVKAIYNTLQKREINYVAGFPGITGGQSILFPAQVLKNKSANCLDGTILFASLLERIGIEAIMVLIPGHSFIGWRTWDDSNTYDFLETTLTWESATFEQANTSGIQTYNDQITSGNFISGLSSIMSLKQARDNGILPWATSLDY